MSVGKTQEKKLNLVYWKQFCAGNLPPIFIMEVNQKIGQVIKRLLLWLSFLKCFCVYKAGESRDPDKTLLDFTQPLVYNLNHASSGPNPLFPSGLDPLQT